MISKKVDDLTIQDIENLVSTGQSESQRLEYKQEIRFKEREDKKELIRDLSALANTQGGYYIIGIQEERGEAIGLMGIELDDVDKYLLQLDQVIRDSLEPRLFGLKTRYFELSTGRFVIVIFVPRSLFPPHRMRDDTIFERSTTGKYPLNMDQIRRLFTRGLLLREEIRNFIHERQDLVCTKRDGAIEFNGHSVVMVHLIPFAAFESEISIAINSKNREAFASNIRPFGPNTGWNLNFNADGYIWGAQNNERGWYTQLFRNGIFEGACDTLIRDYNGINAIMVNQLEINTIDWLA